MHMHVVYTWTCACRYLTMRKRQQLRISTNIQSATYLSFHSITPSSVCSHVPTSPVLCIRELVFTVSPNRLNWGRSVPTTPLMTRPVCMPIRHCRISLGGVIFCCADASFAAVSRPGCWRLMLLARNLSGPACVWTRHICIDVHVHQLCNRYSDMPTKKRTHRKETSVLTWVYPHTHTRVHLGTHLHPHPRTSNLRLRLCSGKTRNIIK